MMENSLASTTRKQYSTALNSWLLFCNENNVLAFNPKASELLQCLYQQFELGASYGTLNSLRSAVSVISESKIGDHPDVCRFLKGVFRSRPPRPRYNATWDANVVLDFLEKQLSDELDIASLTYKTVTLVALASAQRTQTIASIRTSNLIWSPSDVKIKISDLIKTSRPGSAQPLLVFPYFAARPELCVPSLIKLYMEKTKDIRQCDKLFVSPRSPHKAVGAPSIGRWIKNTLSRSGVDTTIFSAHSVRHAASSKAKTRGADINIIFNTAGWSASSRVFAQFYQRPILKDTAPFANFVLNN